MAKRTRSGRPQPGGGRVTPKGHRPAAASDHTGSAGKPAAKSRPAVDPVRSRMPAAPHVPPRAGHHRGQR